MELKVGGLTGDAYGEKSAGRLMQRNGCRDRVWRPVPAASSSASRTLGTGRYFPGFLDAAEWPRRV
jgi:hypothetical protein